MYARQIVSEDRENFEEVKRILHAEIKAKRMILLFKMRNMIIGILCVAICVVAPFACDGDCTIWFVMIPCAIYFFTRGYYG